jgi:hypothetical protein
VHTLHAMIEAKRQSQTPHEATVRLVKPELIVRASSLSS